ncbi:Transposable element tcb2 transposase [Caligus rogercresseyi]|uniref:Transposable element tcb2 transposase n=1 Tax=Caligus rogercresseyi TaxID=217165 RepID=A0A7T8QSQ4_CALRO|nr:Transposable element tcb2 transposase [Caligus rogercresseyi]
MEQARRTTICELWRAGHSAAAIFKMTQYNRKTVYNVVKAFDEEGKTTRKDHSPRSDKIRTPRFVAGLKRSITRTPTTKMTKLAKDRNVSHTTIRRAVKDDLNYRSRCKCVKHLLTAQNKADRVSKGRKILNDLKSKGHYLRFYSDEKIFTVDESVNRRNDRWICQDPKEVKPTMFSKKPAAVMTLAVISSEGDVMVPHFFQANETVNKTVYLDVLKRVVVPWMKKTAGERKYTFQQDSAPAHKAKTVQNYLEANTAHFWPPTFWPANSPDLNPCDFYLWGRVEGIACNTYHKSTVSLKASIKRTMASLDPREVSKAVKSFRRRVETVIELDGEHYE